MERDLTDLMHAHVQAREESLATLTPSESALAGTVRRVKRRRAVRHSFQGVGVGAFVVVVAGASWFGLRGDDHPAPPAVTPTPSVSAPQPTVTPTDDPVVLDEIAGLPPTQALPPGLLERTTPGWALAIYRSLPYGQSDPEPGVDSLPAGVVNTVVLVSPDGELYRVVDLPVDTGVSLLRWDAGSTTAVVSIDWAGDLGVGSESRAVLDLVSGSLTPTPLDLFSSAAYGNYYVGGAADGAELWTEVTSTDAYTSDLYRVQDGGTPRLVGAIGYQWLLDPTGRWLVTNVPGAFTVEPFALLDVVDGTRTELSYGVPGQECGVVGWLDPGQLLAFCIDADHPDVADPVDVHAAYYRVDIDASEATATLLHRLQPAEPRPWTWHGAWAAPGTVAFVGTTAGLGDPSGCAEDAFLWTGESAVPTHLDPGATLFQLASGRPLLVSSSTGCSGDSAPFTLRSYDVTSGASTLLAPPPTPTADVPRWATGLSTWVVGAAR